MKKRTITQAIIAVLEKVGKPLSSKEIYSKIIEYDLYRFRAENPAHIVYIQIRRHCSGLAFPSAKPNKYFQILSDGTYCLLSKASIKNINAKSAEDNINLRSVVAKLKDIHLEYLLLFKKNILSQLLDIHPKTFEAFAKKLLEVYGFTEVEITRYSKDGGIDGYGKLHVGISYLNVAFQCKRWKSTPVSRSEIDKFRGAIQGEYEQGIIFTTSTFSKDAQNATRKSGAAPIILIDGATLVDIMIEKQFGVDSESIPVYINALDRALTEDL